MDAPLSNPGTGPAGGVRETAQPGEAERIEQLARLAADSMKLASLEARVAMSGIGTALVLVLAAGLGATIAIVLSIVALAFVLNGLGLAWPAALGITALAVLLLCYVALRYAGKLAYRLTMPETRRALHPETRS